MTANIKEVHNACHIQSGAVSCNRRTDAAFCESLPE